MDRFPFGNQAQPAPASTPKFIAAARDLGCWFGGTQQQLSRLELAIEAGAAHPEAWADRQRGGAVSSTPVPTIMGVELRVSPPRQQQAEASQAAERFVRFELRWNLRRSCHGGS